jgi:putative nucleotidyltransferase with HDIG domain
MVARVAFVIGRALNRKGSDLNMGLILAGALLHDIGKTRSLREGGNHVELGEKMVLAIGYPEVASIVARHVEPVPETVRMIDEAVVVNYADKRVRHDRIVLLRDRFEDLVERYGKTGKRRSRLRNLGRNAQCLEKALCSELSVTPDELEQTIEKAHGVVLSDCG